MQEKVYSLKIHTYKALVALFQERYHHHLQPFSLLVQNLQKGPRIHQNLILLAISHRLFYKKKKKVLVKCVDLLGFYMYEIYVILISPTIATAHTPSWYFSFKC